MIDAARPPPGPRRRPLNVRTVDGWTLLNFSTWKPTDRRMHRQSLHLPPHGRSMILLLRVMTGELVHGYRLSSSADPPFPPSSILRSSSMQPASSSGMHGWSVGGSTIASASAVAVSSESLPPNPNTNSRRHPRRHRQIVISKSLCLGLRLDESSTS